VTVNPDEVVALGAAVQAGVLAGVCARPGGGGGRGVWRRCWHVARPLRHAWRAHAPHMRCAAASCRPLASTTTHTHTHAHTSLFTTPHTHTHTRRGVGHCAARRDATVAGPRDAGRRHDAPHHAQHHAADEQERDVLHGGRRPDERGDQRAAGALAGWQPRRESVRACVCVCVCVCVRVRAHARVERARCARVCARQQCAAVTGQHPAALLNADMPLSYTHARTRTPRTRRRRASASLRATTSRWARSAWTASRPRRAACRRSRCVARRARLRCGAVVLWPTSARARARLGDVCAVEAQHARGRHPRHA
jgi:hypothetical protein